MSTQQLLVNVIRVPESETLAEGASATVAHGLRSNGKDVSPTNILPQQVSAFSVIEVTDTTITVRNDGPGPSFATFRVERGSSLEVDAGTVQTNFWSGIAPNTIGAGGAITGLAATAPLSVENGTGPVPNYSLGLQAAFTTTAGLLDLADTVGSAGAGAFGNLSAADQSIVPTFTVDRKGRLTAAADGAIKIGGSAARTYVDTGDANTLTAAKSYADGLTRVTSVSAAAPLASSAGTTPQISFSNQNANKVLAGPTSGVDAAPTFRSIVSADLPTNAFPYDVGSLSPSVTGSATLLLFLAVREFTLGALPANYKFRAVTAAASVNTTLYLEHVDPAGSTTPIGNVVFPGDGSTLAPLFTVTTASKVVPAGTYLRLYAGASADTTLANVMFTFSGVSSTA